MEITETLGIDDKDELGTVTAIAQIFDTNVFSRMQSVKVLFKKIVSSV